jgi:hypothetical protein
MADETYCDGSHFKNEPSREKVSFEDLYGVSREELRNNGVDPDEYARKHFDDVLNDPAKSAALQISDTTRLSHEWRKWFLWGYRTLFTSAGFLLLACFKTPFRVPAFIICFAGLAACLYMLVKICTYRVRWAKAVRREGKSIWQANRELYRRK